MSDPFLSQITMSGFSFAPKDYALCDGQVNQISQNAALYSLLGDKYGGDGRSTYGLPDLRGRVPVGLGLAPYYSQGYKYGFEQITLTSNQMPSHTHDLQASTDAQGATAVGTNKTFAPSALPNYAAASNLTPLNAIASTGVVGGGQAHNNLQPYQVISFIIALQGAYPSRN